MNYYTELIEKMRKAGNIVELADGSFDMYFPTVKKCHDAANAIEQLVADYEILAKMYAKANEDLCVRTKERDAYAKAFRITRSDETLTNHAVFKVDYADLIDHSTDELVLAIAYGLARTIEDERSTGG